MTTRRDVLFGWLRPDPAPAGTGGTARVNPFDCLNGRGSFCSTCVERCPVPGAMTLEGRLVRVDAARCTGCGVCARVCPAPGGGAILLLPRRAA